MYSSPRVKSVGQVLKEAREAQFYSLIDVERHTKIRQELLEALERDDFSKLPPATFIQGFIKNYSEFLGLSQEKMLALFRRDYEAKKHPPQILESLRSPLENKRLRITPSRVLGLLVGVIIIGFFAYLWIEYHQFVAEPKLEVTSPVDQMSVDIPQVSVEGVTDPEAKVSVNDQEIGVDNNGHFREDVKLSASTNKITITATGKFGKSATIDRTVFVKK